jgi:hypothetical protein
VESGQISAIVPPQASRETSPCPQHWLSSFPVPTEVSLNFLFRSFLRKWRASLPYEKACKTNVGCVYRPALVLKGQKYAEFIFLGKLQQGKPLL